MPRIKLVIRSNPACMISGQCSSKPDSKVEIASPADLYISGSVTRRPCTTASRMSRPSFKICGRFWMIMLKNAATISSAASATWPIAEMTPITKLWSMLEPVARTDGICVPIELIQSKIVVFALSIQTGKTVWRP